MEKIAANLRAFSEAVKRHDADNPGHSPANGIGVAHFDIERLGFEDGEELWPGVRIVVDGRTSGNFRVLCDGNHNTAGEESVEVELVRAVGIAA